MSGRKERPVVNPNSSRRVDNTAYCMHSARRSPSWQAQTAVVDYNKSEKATTHYVHTRSSSTVCVSTRSNNSISRIFLTHTPSSLDGRDTSGLGREGHGRHGIANSRACEPRSPEVGRALGVLGS